MKAVLLIGGQATRLAPLSNHIPKSLLPVCDREVIHYQISQLARAGINEIVLAAGHMVDQLAAHVSNYTGGLQFAVSTEPEPLGTAGAIAHAARLVTGEQVVVLNADIISSVSISEVIEKHNKSGKLATIVGQKVPDPSRFGLLELAGDEVTGFVEKPAEGEYPDECYINAGIYVLEPDAVQQIPVGRKVSIERETFPQLIERHGSLNHFPSDGLWADIGTFESYFAANFQLLARRYAGGEDTLWGERSDCAIFKDLVYLNKSARLDGKVDLFHRVIVMDGAAVGDGTRLQNCLVLPRAEIAAETRLQDCIVCEGAAVGPGEFANLVFIRGEEPQPFFPEAAQLLLNG
jgi:mannose-1-phosphate guanylyltransferase